MDIPKDKAIQQPLRPRPILHTVAEELRSYRPRLVVPGQQQSVFSISFCFLIKKEMFNFISVKSSIKTTMVV